MTLLRRLSVAIALIAALPLPAAADTLRRFTVVVGANFGGDDRPRLRYAVSDARRFGQVLTELGGVAPEDEVVLSDPGADQLLEALATLGARLAAERRRAAGGRIEVLFYYSGHADEKGLLLGEDRVSYRALRDQLDALPADVRIAVLDACASGAFTRLKGGRRRPPFAVDASATMRGHAFLTSSSATEAAQESDRIGASYFTHYLVSGFRGAADLSGDGRVTLNEAYQFAFAETVGRTAGTAGGAQHPSYDINLTGAGDVVMTDVAQTTATLELGDDVDGRVYVRTARQALVVELSKSRGRTVALGLEPGVYDLWLDSGRVAGRSRVTLTDGGRRRLDAAQFTAASREATRLRGNRAPDDSGARYAVAGTTRLSMTLGGWGSRGTTIPGSGLDVAGGGHVARYLGERWAITGGLQGFGAEEATAFLGGFAVPIGVRWNPWRGAVAAQRLKPFVGAGVLPVLRTSGVGYGLGTQLQAGLDVHLTPRWSVGGRAGYNAFPFTDQSAPYDDFRGREFALDVSVFVGRRR